MQALRVDTDTRLTDTPTPTVHRTGIGGESFDIKKKNKRGEKKGETKKNMIREGGATKKKPNKHAYNKQTTRGVGPCATLISGITVPQQVF